MRDGTGERLPLAMRVARAVFSRMARPHRLIYKMLGGRLINRKEDGTLLMLTTTGRKSGLLRSVLVNHVRDGDDFVVVGSNWGRAEPPNWLLNLEARPRAGVRLGQREYPVTARFPEGDERDRLWKLVMDRMPALQRVADSANRELRVVKLVRS